MFSPDLCIECEQSYQETEIDLLCAACRSRQPLQIKYNGLCWQKQGGHQCCEICKKETDLLYTNACLRCFDFDKA
jgi:hypothetical protein